MQPEEIVRQNQNQHITAHMRSCGITDKVKGTQSFLRTQLSRDWRLSVQDVLNIKAELDKRVWRFHPNQQQSILMWTQQHAGDVLLYEEQRPLTGTPDYEYYMAEQRSSMAAAETVDSSTSGFHFFSDPEHTEEVLQEPAAEEAQVVELLSSSAAADIPAAGGGSGADTVWLPDEPEVPRSQAATADVYREGQKVFTYDANNWSAFNLAFTTDFGVEAALEYGHKRPLVMDSTHGSNNVKVPLTTVMVVDDHNNGIPVGWLFSSSESIDSVSRFLMALRERLWCCFPI